MIPSFVITFRETLEAALIVGIVLGYLGRTNQRRYRPSVYLGVLFGVVASAIGALAFERLAGGFAGTAEQVFEGITMLVGAALLTTMIFWMMGQKHIADELRQRVAAEVAQARRLGLFALVFMAVLREGIETVIFLGAASFAAGGSSLLGGAAGVVAAIVLGYVIFIGAMKVNLRTFFNVTSVVLILFAAGLVAHGVHELQEAGMVPTLVEHVWDINPAVTPDGSYPLLHENGYVGSFLKALLGYNGNPSLLEVTSWAAYLALVSLAWRARENAFSPRQLQSQNERRP